MEIIMYASLISNKTTKQALANSITTPIYFREYSTMKMRKSADWTIFIHYFIFSILFMISSDNNIFELIIY